MLCRNAMLAVLVVAGAHSSAQISTPPDTSQEAAVFDQVSNRIRFENDGSGEHVSTAVISVQSEAAVQDLGQLFTRPVVRWNPYSMPADGLFICSSSTPPGGGVHGMCGYHAAKTALSRLQKK